MFEDSMDHIATGSESLAEFAHNAGMDNPEQCWLLDGRDVWVRNPFYHGPEQPHPEDDYPEHEQNPPKMDFENWRGDSKDTGIGCD